MLAFPFIVLLGGSILCLLFWSKPRAQRWIGLCAVSVYLFFGIALVAEVRVSGALTLQIGGYGPPAGITLVADLFSALMALIAGIIGLACYLYGIQDVSQGRQSRGYHPIFLFLMLGVNGSFLAGDVFNLYVWFEVMLVASFVLISLGSTRAQLEGSVKYVIINFIASGLFLIGLGVLYKVTGTMNMAHIAQVLAEMEERDMATLSSLFFLVCFGIKAAIFPLFFWLPASYHTPPASVSGLMAGLLTKVGVYALMRFFTLFFNYDPKFSHNLILVIAGFTMLTGVLGAMSQMEFRRILSFHIVSQIGYMIMGLGIFTPIAVAGAIFYMIHHIIVKTNLFLVSGICNKLQGSYSLKRLGGLYGAVPVLAAVFAISGFSLAGVPPLSGFWGKFFLAKAGFEAEQFLIIAIALLVGLLTLFSMIKIWQNVFWGEQAAWAEGLEAKGRFSQWRFARANVLMFLPVILLASLTVAIGLFPAFLVDLSMEAARQLMNPQEYIHAVLGGGASQ